MPAKYLITGGAGFIGSHLTDRLAGRGHHVTVLDDLSSGSARNLEAAMAGGRVRLGVGSVLDSELVGRCVRDVDACIHLAAALAGRAAIAGIAILSLDTRVCTAAKRLGLQVVP